MGSICTKSSPIYSDNVNNISSSNSLDNSLDLFNPFDNYYVVGILGHGGFGSVFKCVDKNTNKLYAIKVIDVSDIYQNRDSVISERKILNKCNHPFILKLYHSFIYKSLHAFVFKFTDSVSMEKVLGKLSLSICIKYCSEIINALLYLHQCNIIYRDLKPGNILITSANTILIIDFGSAMYYNPIFNNMTDVYGTMSYMPPEIVSLQKANHTPSIDWWSFGVVMYILISGKHPYKNKIIKGKISHILIEKWISELTFNAFDIDISICLKKLLTIDPIKRMGENIEYCPPFNKLFENRSESRNNSIYKKIRKITEGKTIEFVNKQEFIKTYNEYTCFKSKSRSIDARGK